MDGNDPQLSPAIFLLFAMKTFKKQQQKKSTQVKIF